MQRTLFLAGKATVVIQHDARDLDKLPVFPESGKVAVKRGQGGSRRPVTVEKLRPDAGE